MPAAAEAEHQKTLDLAAILARIVFVDLIDFGLVHLNFAATVDDVLPVGFDEVGGHLYFAAFTPEINFSLLRLGFIDDFLVLVPDDPGLSGSEVSRGGIHLGENFIEPGGIALRPRCSGQQPNDY